MQGIIIYCQYSTGSNFAITSRPPQPFLFIKVSKDGKSDVKSQRLVKKHVMRDIANARRKNTNHGKKNLFQFPLWLPPTDELEMYQQRNAKLGAETALTQPEIYTSEDYSVALEDTWPTSRASQGIERMGAVRYNPFLAYPVSLDVGSRFLLDFSRNISLPALLTVDEADVVS